MLDKVGIKAKVKQVEAAVLSEVVRTGDYQAFIYSQQTGPDPQAALKCFHSTTPQSACNYMNFKNAEFDKLIDEAGQSDDAAKRGQLLQKANAMLYEEAPVWFFNYNKAVMADAAVAPRPSAERDRADPSERRRPLGRRDLAREVTRARALPPSRRQMEGGKKNRRCSPS